MQKEFINPSGALESKPRGYSHAIKVGGVGSLLFLAGQAPLDGNLQLIGPGDIEAQTRATFQNIKRALEASGATFTDIVKMIVYCTDIETQQWPIRNVRGEFIDVNNPPVSTMIEISKLAVSGMMIEIDIICAMA